MGLGGVEEVAWALVEDENCCCVADATRGAVDDAAVVFVPFVMRGCGAVRDAVDGGLEVEGLPHRCGRKGSLMSRDHLEASEGGMGKRMSQRPQMNLEKAMRIV